MVGKIKNEKPGRLFSSVKQVQNPVTAVIDAKGGTPIWRDGVSPAKCRIVRVMCVGNMREMEGQLLVF